VRQSKPLKVPDTFSITWLLVWTVWVLWTSAALWFVNSFSTDIPSGDDFELVEVFTGHKPFTLQWLWSLHNEHRIVLPRLLLLTLHQTVGLHSAGMYAIVVMLSLSAMICVLAAAQIRGRPSVTDTFFPLLWLHWGQAENLLWSFQVGFALPCLLIAIVVFLLSSSRSGKLQRTVTLLGLISISLILCGGNGILMAGPLLLLLWSVVIRRDLFLQPASEKSTGSWWPVVGLLVAASLLLCFYFVGFHTAPHAASNTPGLSKRISTLFQFFAVAWGPSSSNYWEVVGPLTFLLMICSGALILKSVCREKEYRFQSLGLLTLLVSPALLSAAVAIARTAQGGNAPRYTTLLLPSLAACYLVGVYVVRLRWRTVWQSSLLLMAVALQLNFSWALRYGEAFAERRWQFVSCLRAGLPSAALSAIFHQDPYPVYIDDRILNDRLIMLHDAKVYPFAEMTVSDHVNVLRIEQLESGTTFNHKLSLNRPTRVYLIEFDLVRKGKTQEVLPVTIGGSNSLERGPSAIRWQQVCVSVPIESRSFRFIMNSTFDTLTFENARWPEEFSITNLVLYTD
jgi:hypothetical protein